MMQESAFLQFKQTLEERSGKKLDLRWNENRSSILDIQWRPGCPRVSLHRFFLKAPPPVVEALVRCLRKQERKVDRKIRHFIDESVKDLNYSRQVKRSRLTTRGERYDLQEMYNRVNRDYFDSSLDLSITWFGRANGKPCSQITFGLYHDALRLVKIHRRLDHPSVPEYFVQFVVYHEIVHSLCPPYPDPVTGRQRIHSPEFKEVERKFLHYEKAKAWSKKNRERFFKGEW